MNYHQLLMEIKTPEGVGVGVGGLEHILITKNRIRSFGLLSSLHHHAQQVSYFNEILSIKCLLLRGLINKATIQYVSFISNV